MLLHGRVSCAGSALFGLLGVATAQGPPPSAPDAGAALSQSVGLHQAGDTLVAGGPDYKAEFAAAGVTFVPARGRRAPRNRSVRFALTSIARGGAAWQAADAVPVRGGELEVHYRRGSVLESYEVRADGLEQRFAFTELPAGSGNLIVRGRLETDLAPSSEGRATDGLTFSDGSLGGVRIGAITGIDARGERAPGTMRVDGDKLELSLPAAFVDTAALPLVVDPLIGPALLMPAGSGSDDDPDVCYDATEDLYLVVWERRFSGADVDIVGQRVAADGSLFGGTLFIRNDPSNSADPAVANVAGRFEVFFSEGFPLASRALVACTVEGATGRIRDPVTVRTGGGGLFAPDVGADPASATGRVLFAWYRFETGMTSVPLELRQATVAPNGDLILSPTILQHPTGRRGARPSVSPSPGPDGLFLVGYEYWPLLGQRWIEAIAVDGVPSIRASVALDVVRNAELPAVTGDGSKWVVAYHRDPGPRHRALRRRDLEPARPVPFPGLRRCVAVREEHRAAARRIVGHGNAERLWRS